MDQRRKFQIIGVLLFAFALMYAISLSGHSTDDDYQIVSDEAVFGNPFAIQYSNPGGMMGAYISYTSFFFLGWPAFLMIPFLMMLSLKLADLGIGKRLYKHASMALGVGYLIFLLFDISKVSSLRLYGIDVPDGVGALGQSLLELSIRLIGISGTYIITLAAIISLLVLYAAISHRFRNLTSAVGEIIRSKSIDLFERIRTGFMEGLKKIDLRGKIGYGKDQITGSIRKLKRTKILGDVSYGNENEDEFDEPAEDEIMIKAPPKKRPRRKVVLPGKKESTEANNDPEDVIDDDSDDQRVFNMPGPELLEVGDQIGEDIDEKALTAKAQSLRETLETFGVRLDGNIQMFPGPVITRFEIKPAAGIKVNQIANLSEDLALNLRAKSIRIVAPIPGKAAVGIEIPNHDPQIVYLRDIITSDEYLKTRYKLPLAIGKDISGKPFVADLTEMPHMLIAGTTGSGKSVCINSIITSLTYALHPDKLRFIFIDPKMLELSIYKGIPYLDENVVTNAKQAERVLSDTVAEMERRYRKLAAGSVRNIVDHNARQKTDADKLPYIVIIIDELADLMMSTHSNRVELLITRLAQMARAVGIHLILATQRPSVDVITGLIKANFPTRIAFQVATRTDSRTILDGNGAERLLGNGDMLFLDAGSPQADRLHGAYISSQETERLVEFLKSQPFTKVKAEESKKVSEEKAQLRQFNDPVLMEAVETVIRQNQASVSLLQRKLGIGYQRAARLIDDLEEMKIIGGYNESKARDVLVDKAFLEDIRNGKVSKT